MRMNAARNVRTKGLLGLFLLLTLLPFPTQQAHSEEPVCNVDQQGDAWDTCVAFCDTLDCDSGAGPAALCAELLNTYHEERPGFEPPCVQ